MMAFVIIVIVGALLMQAQFYKGHINDLRDAFEHQRKMRRYEEERADALSAALFGRHTRPRSDTKRMN